MKVEAQIVLAKCRANQLYGIRVEKKDKDWLMTWAFKMNEKKAVSEGYTEQKKLEGSFPLAENYPGCPYCGAKQLILCENCGKISCYHPEMGEVVTCQWCSQSGEAEAKSTVGLESHPQM